MNMNNRIKEILKEKGLTQKFLADALGVSTNSISMTLSGNPTLGTLQKIAEALGVPLSELFAEREKGVITCPHCGKNIVVEATKPEE